MNDSRLIVRLPSADRTFVQGYAAQYGISVSDVIRQCLAKLKESLAVADIITVFIIPAVKGITGLTLCGDVNICIVIRSIQFFADYIHIIINIIGFSFRVSYQLT